MLSLKIPGRQADTGTVCPEDRRNKIVRNRERIGPRPDLHRQEPPCEPLLDAVKAVTCGRLRALQVLNNGPPIKHGQERGRHSALHGPTEATPPGDGFSRR